MECKIVSTRTFDGSEPTASAGFATLRPSSRWGEGSAASARRETLTRFKLTSTFFASFSQTHSADIFPAAYPGLRRQHSTLGNKVRSNG